MAPAGGIDWFHSGFSLECRTTLPNVSANRLPVPNARAMSHFFMRFDPSVPVAIAAAQAGADTISPNSEISGGANVAHTISD